MELGGTFTMLLTLCLFCLLILIAWKQISKGGKLPPGPTPIPFLGNLLQIRTDATFQSLMKLREKYGPVFTVYMGPRPVVVLCGHEAVKEALVDQAEEFSGRGELASIERNFQGHGAPTEPTFFLSRTVSNVISSVVFGSRFDYEDKQFQKLLQMINQSFIEMSTPWAQLYDMYSGIMQYLPGRHNRIYYLVEGLKDFIASRVKINEESFDPQNPRDFIDCFLIRMHQDKNNPNTEFTLKNLVLTTLNLFFAGTETVSSTLRYGFLLLMKHPEVEAKIHEEIDQVIGPHRIPSVDDRVKMPYTDAVIHEIQRMTDIVPLGVPHNVIRDTHFRGYLLPKGTDVFPLLGSVLKDPKYFRYPDAFYPQHFLDEQGRFKKNEAFVPFSSGKRICLGEAMARMELFLYFTSILQNFSLRPLVPPADIDITPKISGFGNIPPTYELCLMAR
ncbi:cytochrome P450 2G1 isoform X2 [Phyllostomus discolor]|uniref:Cytochrome P450 n=1 Tax=Phyllostomus discolor TaxID=89673 RepID=A0A7E6CLP8_9CHIR|nr:cytochrome P450 2G1 isoform X2 [Phyllostomus discolor]